jgi:hypothetical protein
LLEAEENPIKPEKPRSRKPYVVCPTPEGIRV